MTSVILASICLAIWAGLIGARGGFWLANVRDTTQPPAPAPWPAVTVVIPARNEAETIAATVGSLTAQDYPGPLSIVVVDDDSDDGTGAEAQAAGAGSRVPVTVMAGQGPPAGWTGKLWALKLGIEAADRQAPAYLLLTDADITHAPDSVSWLVAQALSGGYALTSLMARLRCRSLAERSHVPAFVYFFQMLFPFAWVCRRDRATAAGAGGCMLVQASALRAAGGVASVRDALIDDCALARRLKAQGPIWLGLADRVRSERPYDDWASVRDMIARSAYAQLDYSPLRLLGTVAGMALVFMAPVGLALLADGAARWMGLAAWALMALSFQPMLRFYRLSPLWGLALPGIALLYVMYTVESAWRHVNRRGGQWKGRVQADVSGVR